MKTIKQLTIAGLFLAALFAAAPASAECVMTGGKATVTDDPNCFRDGKKHGQWRMEFANGTVQEGQMTDGIKQGEWRIRFADGQVQSGAFVDGKKHGKWTYHYASGSSSEVEFAGGRQVGAAKNNFAPDSRSTPKPKPGLEIPDLVLHFIGSPASVTAGENFQLAAFVQNNGNGLSLPTQFRLTRNGAEVKSGRVGLVSHNNPPREQDIRVSVVAPSEAGSVTYRMCVDKARAGDIAGRSDPDFHGLETNMTNNCATEQIKVIAATPAPATVAPAMVKKPIPAPAVETADSADSEKSALDEMLDDLESEIDGGVASESDGIDPGNPDNLLDSIESGVDEVASDINDWHQQEKEKREIAEAERQAREQEERLAREQREREAARVAQQQREQEAARLAQQQKGSGWMNALNMINTGLDIAKKVDDMKRGVESGIISPSAASMGLVGEGFALGAAEDGARNNGGDGIDYCAEIERSKTHLEQQIENARKGGHIGAADRAARRAQEEFYPQYLADKRKYGC